MRLWEWNPMTGVGKCLRNIYKENIMRRLLNIIVSKYKREIYEG